MFLWSEWRYDSKNLTTLCEVKSGIWYIKAQKPIFKQIFATKVDLSLLDPIHLSFEGLSWLING